jgi:hypothetical protein
VVGIGEEIVDPDTGDNLGQLEVVRGKVKVEHVQDNFVTMKSSVFTKSSDKREIKKIKRDSRAHGIAYLVGGPATEEVETVIPGKITRDELRDVRVGDKIKAISTK